MKTKRYLLFAGDMYEQRGGWHDFVKSFDSIGETMTAIDDLHLLEHEDTWAHIVDTELGCIICVVERSSDYAPEKGWNPWQKLHPSPPTWEPDFRGMTEMRIEQLIASSATADGIDRDLLAKKIADWRA